MMKTNTYALCLSYPTSTQYRYFSFISNETLIKFQKNTVFLLHFNSNFFNRFTHAQWIYFTLFAYFVWSHSSSRYNFVVVVMGSCLRWIDSWWWLTEWRRRRQSVILITIIIVFFFHLIIIFCFVFYLIKPVTYTYLCSIWNCRTVYKHAIYACVISYFDNLFLFLQLCE